MSKVANILLDGDLVLEDVSRRLWKVKVNEPYSLFLESVD